MALQVQRDVYKDQSQKCQDIITHLRTLYVDHAEDPGKDNIVMIIEKNTTPEEDEFYEYPYYIARIQQRFITTKRRWFKEQYPHHRFIIGELANVNSIHAFNRFEEKGYVERFIPWPHLPSRYKAFFLRAGTVAGAGLVKFS